MGKNVDLESTETEEKEKESDDVELLERSEDLKDESGELGDCLRVLDKVLELGAKRLKPDIGVDRRADLSADFCDIGEGEMIVCLRRVMLDHADVFEALCWNIERQLKGGGRDTGDEVENSGLAITLRRDEKASVDVLKEEKVKVLTLIRKTVQLVHLDAMKECFEVGNEEGAFSHIPYLYLDRGVEEAAYRYVYLGFLST